ncbi:hypothetical protein HRbin36_01030 [bacterium HR36]|nr:hypothetical protein HRbin36_01030 [bacterium HR36]
MRRMSLGPTLLVLVLITLNNLGCGGPKRPLVEVSGKVLFDDGAPLPAGTRIILEPMEGGIGAASGETSADGSFRLRHVSGKTGAELGQYRVRLAAPKGDHGAFLQLVPPSYVEGNELFLEVKQSMGEVTLRVKRQQQAS